MTLDYRVFRAGENPDRAASGRSGDDRGETLLAEGYTRHVCLNASGRAVRPPKFLLDAVAAAESAASAPDPAADSSPPPPDSSPEPPPPEEPRP